MRVSCAAVLSAFGGVILAATLPAAGASLVPVLDHASPYSPDLVFTNLHARDGHGHGHHGSGAPLLQLNETEVLSSHGLTPPSYFTVEFDDGQGHPWVMGTHAAFMCLAFFVALPAGLALRSVKHPLHGVAVAAFWTFSILGTAAGGLYRKMMPNMYEHAVHARHSYMVLGLAAVLTTIDVLSVVRRLITYVIRLRAGELSFSFRGFWRTVVLDNDSAVPALEVEYAKLVGDEVHELRSPADVEADGEEAHWENAAPLSAASDRTVFGRTSVSSEHTFVGRPVLGRRGSHYSDETLNELDADAPPASRTRRLARHFGSRAFHTTERVLVFAAFAELLEGLIVYTGGCRGNYVNGCLAHLIKGGIFWCYGLATFGRFVGAFADLGWAWNQRPAGGGGVSAELVESIVVFTYGATNVWMERFGAAPGAPYTTKEIQHISIAAMFAFAGLIGIALESTAVRGWLAAAAVAGPAARRAAAADAIEEPASYRGSFNPFPALVIGVTGAAMSAHFQRYLFQVQIHDLWGKLLVGFAVLRCLTYFFVWIAPPRSILPSRPPTEALGSFFLACGGLVFMLSTEEVTFAAMRRGRDDVMMFLNVAVAITCFAFSWAFAVVAFKGWLKTRAARAVPAFRPAP